MFYVVSKVFWGAVQPISLIFLLFLASLVLGFLGRRRASLVAGCVALVLFGAAAFTTLGDILIAPLENRFTRPADMPDDVAAIIMLGGATSARVSRARQVAELNEAGDRLTETVWLARRYPTARVVLSGGVGILFADLEPEAVTAERFLVAQGIEPQRLVLEARSRNTDENAALTLDMLGDPGGSVLLVTSAFHMPRSVGIFRQAGLEVIAWPTDYRSAGNDGFSLDFANPALNLTTTGIAMREWIGLAVYAWTGKSSALLPAQASN